MKQPEKPTGGSWRADFSALAETGASEVDITTALGALAEERAESEQLRQSNLRFSAEAERLRKAMASHEEELIRLRWLAPGGYNGGNPA